MPSRKLVNIHAHIHVNGDVPQIVREWSSWGCVKCCVLADCAFWQPPYSTYLGNDGVQKWMRKYPDIIVGMGSIELGHQMGTPDDISSLRDKGFSGLKFEMPSHPYDHDRYMPLYERAQELGMPILFHTGRVAALVSSDIVQRLTSDHMRPYRLDRIAKAFPTLRIIGAHLGLPHAHEALALLDLPNVYFDISGGSGQKKHISLLKQALSPFPGANMTDRDENLALQYFEKLAFGTDNPPISVWFPAAEELMDYFQISEATRERFYWRNAYDIFGWPE